MMTRLHGFYLSIRQGEGEARTESQKPQRLLVQSLTQMAAE